MDFLDVSKRSFRTALVVAGGLLLSLATFFVVYHWETQRATERIESVFYLDASDRVAAIQRELDAHLLVLRALGALYAASEQVTRREFHFFASGMREAIPSIQALEWIPRIAGAERARYEADARHAIPGFRIRERGADGSLIPARPRDSYYPVYFVEPLVGNEAAPGFDLASEPVRREALCRARDSGRIAASRPVTLVQESGRQHAFLAFLPVYRKGMAVENVAQRRQYLEGLVLVVCRVGDLIDHAVAQLAGKDIDLWVFDTSAASRRLLHAHAAADSAAGPVHQPPTAGPRVEHLLEVGGRRWRIVAAPAAASLVPPSADIAWLILCSGLAITGLLAWYLRALQRTALDMSAANLALDREVHERRQTEAALKQSETRFRQVLESAADAIVISGRRGLILTANKQAERLFGYGRHELIGQPVERLLPEDAREKHAESRQAYHAHPGDRPAIRDLELVGRRKDGSLVPVEISLSPVGRDAAQMVTAIIRDVTARKRAEAELRALSRAHALLSRCNGTLARAVAEQDLLDAFCRNLVEVGGYGCAWIGFVRQRGTGGVRMVAHVGAKAAGLPDTAMLDVDVEAEYSISGAAIRTGEPQILGDLETETGLGRWRDKALWAGYRALIALPVKAEGRAFGNFSLFSVEEDPFTATEVALLMELAEDLGFGIETLRARAAHGQKVRRLREEVEQEERRRIAAMLHDGVAQSVQAVNLGLKRLRALAGEAQALRPRLLNQVIDEVGVIIAQLRDISHELRPVFLERMGLLEAIRYHCGELGVRAGMSISLAGDPGSLQLGEREKEQCFLVFREALGNAVKHARAGRIDVTLEASAGDALTLRIQDDGVGFDPGKAFESPSGLGLAMISERVESVGGHAEIQSIPGAGTRVSIRIPLRQVST